MFKTFSTRLAAEAFVAGWDGAGRHALPVSYPWLTLLGCTHSTKASSPRPLREHLAINFPAVVPLSTSTSLRRPSYHAQLLSTLPPLPTYLPADTDFAAEVSTMPSFYDRPSLRHSTTSVRTSLVRVPSPLRSQVDDDEAGPSRPPIRKSTRVIGPGGLLSPPSSSSSWLHPSPVLDRDRPTKPRGATEAGLWASSQYRNFPGIGIGLGLLLPPSSPPLLATDQRKSASENTPLSPISPSGLWGEARVALPSPLAAQSQQPDVELVDKNAPKFSRCGLRKSGIVMPVAAARTNSSSSLRSVSSQRSFLSPSSSSTSLPSLSSGQSTPTVRRQHSFQDRLASLAETTQRELQLNEEGLLALSALSPPRPAFMGRSPSSSSLSSEASGHSLGSLTSASSVMTPSIESSDPITEEDVDGDIQISWTKSVGDVEGSVNSPSMKIENPNEKKKKGGMFKRFTQALKLDKKDGCLGLTDKV